jgi:hypothetical protein
MPTLIDLSQTLRSVADALNDYADTQADPFDPSLAQLRTTAAHLIIDASIIGQRQLGAMAKEVSDAIAGLQGQVRDAQNAIKIIDNVKAAVSIGAAVLSVAAAVATGNPLGAADKVTALADMIASAIKANSGGAEVDEIG